MTHGYELQLASLTHTHRRRLDCGSSRPGSRLLRIRPAQRPRTTMAPRSKAITTDACAGGPAKVYARRSCAVTLADKVGYGEPGVFLAYFSRLLLTTWNSHQRSFEAFVSHR